MLRRVLISDRVSIWGLWSFWSCSDGIKTSTLHSPEEGPQRSVKSCRSCFNLSYGLATTSNSSRDSCCSHSWRQNCESEQKAKEAQSSSLLPLSTGVRRTGTACTVIMTDLDQLVPVKDLFCDFSTCLVFYQLCEVKTVKCKLGLFSDHEVAWQHYCNDRVRMFSSDVMRYVSGNWNDTPLGRQEWSFWVVTIYVKRQFVLSGDSSEATILSKFQKATIRPIFKRRQFVPIVRSCNSSPI